ncbi:MAG: diiron oxygenase [Alphaproteobacteria bacterium]|nr:diiron oxygenase [Alphaproteobacteria bacterium]MCB9695734.1 diiron oxygenase [Alphaproteobacteria bacterium]
MSPSADLDGRLVRGSVSGVWSLDGLAWPDALDRDQWASSPEWLSIFGTPAWEAADERTRKRLSLTELAAFFSLTLHGERPLVAGLVHRMHDGRRDRLASRYLHHFLEEESRHMVMFGEFCDRYHRVYPMPRLALGGPDPDDEVRFGVRALVVEEVGLHFNAVYAADERLPPIVRQINALHRRDELRHVAWGREALREAVAAVDEDALPKLRRWTTTYLRQSLEDLCNARALADAGIPEPHEVRAATLAHPAFRARCAEAAAPLVARLRDLRLLEPPESP